MLWTQPNQTYNVLYDLAPTPIASTTSFPFSKNNFSYTQFTAQPQHHSFSKQYLQQKAALHLPQIQILKQKFCQQKYWTIRRKQSISWVGPLGSPMGSPWLGPLEPLGSPWPPWAPHGPPGLPMAPARLVERVVYGRSPEFVLSVGWQF